MLQYKKRPFEPLFDYGNYSPKELTALLTSLVTELLNPVKIVVNAAATMPNTISTKTIPNSCPLISDIVSSFLTVKTYYRHPFNADGHFLFRNHKWMICCRYLVYDFFTECW